MRADSMGVSLLRPRSRHRRNAFYRYGEPAFASAFIFRYVKGIRSFH